MSDSPECPSRADYTVGWICALRAEYTAAQVFLDVKHPQPDMTGNSPGDDNHYTHGAIAGHNVVIAVLPGGDYGTASAANVATNLSRSYPNVRIGLMVGIGGGAPTSDRDIRLGDVVVSEPENATSGVFQYDFGKVVQEGDYEYTKVLNKPPVVLRTALTGLKSRYEIDGHNLEQAVEDVLAKNKRLRKTYGKPSSDVLVKSHVLHSASCQEADCSRQEENLVERETRDEDDNIHVHYGLVATGNSVMKDATLRDEFAKREGVLCFEMEAGGLMDTLPCLVVRGICDYSDSHKNKQWQGYAALVAAAFAKELLVEVRPSAVQSERQLSEILKTIADTATETHSQVASFLDTEAREGYLQWLSSDDAGAYHSDIIEKRSPNTGQWFLESSEYNLWRSGEHQTLFCPGIPGAGKTMIMAIVIDDLVQQYHDDKEVGIAWIYYDFRHRGSQGLEQMLGSLLRQLTSRCVKVPKSIKGLHLKHSELQTRPSYRELMGVLDDVCACFKRVYIVIDALDECLVEGDRRTLPGALKQLQENTRVNLIATSRHIPDIKTAFVGQPCLEISAAPKDLTAYLKDTIHKFPSSIQHDTELHNEIQSQLIDTCQGMFLLMKLYMDSLCDKTSKREIRDALKRLTRLDAQGQPSEHQQSAVLDAAYSDVVDRIKAQPRGHRDLALRVLMWITFAKISLSLDTLRAAVCTIVGDRTFDVDNLRDANTLISLCCGLVTLDEKSDAARLVHYTTQSYLEEYQSSWAPTAQRILTRDCITHLMYDIPKPGEPLTESRFSHARYQSKRERLQKSSNPSAYRSDMPTSYDLMSDLYDYSACFWAHHYKLAEGKMDEVGELLQSDDHVHTLMVNAINRLESLGHLRGILAKSTPFPDSDAGSSITSFFQPLHLVAFLGLGDFVDEALQGLSGGLDLLATAPGIEASETRSFTPMELAILAGQSSMVQRLVDEGASLNTEIYDFQPAPLLFALQVKSFDMVGVLLRCGADVNRRRKFDGRTPLMISASPKSENTLRRLIEINADVNLLDHSGFSALQIAVTSDSTPAAEMLLEAGADINTRDSQQWTPLMWACVVGGPMVDFLLQKGADIHAVDDRKRSVLVHAVGLMEPQFVDWILEAGADIDAQDIYGETPLMKAAGWASHQILKMLLEKGANVNVVDQKGQSALIKAAMALRSQYIEDLIGAGADINHRDEFGETALMKICQVQDQNREEERQRSWELLLENGALCGDGKRHEEQCLFKDKCPVFEQLSASVSGDISRLEIHS